MNNYTNCLTMFIKWYIVFHKGFKVTSMISHVFNCFPSVPHMWCVISFNLIPQSTKQAISRKKKTNKMLLISLYGSGKRNRENTYLKKLRAWDIFTSQSLWRGERELPSTYLGKCHTSITNVHLWINFCFYCYNCPCPCTYNKRYENAERKTHFLGTNSDVWLKLVNSWLNFRLLSLLTWFI